MSQNLASGLVLLFEIYVAVGVLFAVYFVVKGAGKVDEVAREGTWGFRVLIFPGVAALWPLLASRLLRGVAQPPVERNPHRRLAADATSEDTP